MEVLRAKHPEAQKQTAVSLDLYPDLPPELTRGAGPGGTDSVSLQLWLLWFEAARWELRMIVGDFVEWMGSGRPPWVAYRALMSGRLIVLDKQPVIRSVGVGETWRRMMAK